MGIKRVMTGVDVASIYIIYPDASKVEPNPKIYINKKINFMKI